MNKYIEMKNSINRQFQAEVNAFAWGFGTGAAIGMLIVLTYLAWQGGMI